MQARKATAFSYFLFTVLLTCVLAHRSFSYLSDDPGVGWHLKSGAWIIDHKQVMRVDPFLSEERPWVSDQWLSDVVMAGLFSIGGWGLLYTITLCLFLVPCLVLFVNAIRKSDAHCSLLALVIALSIAISGMSVHLILRPLIISFVFFALQLTAVIGVLQSRSMGEQVSFSIKPYLHTFVMYVAWANMHPSFLLGIGVLLLAAVAVVVDRFFLGAQYPDSTVTQHFLVLATIAALGTLINPYGWHLHESIITLGHSEFFMTLNTEWLPLNARSSEGQMMMMGLSLIVFMMYLRTRLTYPTEEVPAQEQGFAFQASQTFLVGGTIGFSVLGFGSVRFLPYASMFGFFPLFGNLDWFFTRYLDSPRRVISSKTTVVFGAISLCMVVGSFVYPKVIFGERVFGPSNEKFPYSLITRVRDDAAQNFDATEKIIIYNHPDLGGFFIYYGNVETTTSKKQKIVPVLDDRNTLLGEAPYKEFLNAKTEHALAEAAAEHHAQYVVTNEKLLPVLLDGKDLHEIGRFEKYILFKLNKSGLNG